MRIWHFEAGPDPDSVDGKSTLLWRLAAAQARAGHDVTLFCTSTPSRQGAALAEESGLRVVEMPTAWRRYRPWRLFGLGGPTPQLVHLHSGWVPAHAAIAWWCRRRRLAYAQAPHGVHTPVLLAASPTRRRLYLRLVERRTTFGASLVVYASQAEADEAARLFGRVVPRTGLAPFPAPTLGVTPSWTWSDRPGPVVFLGRYDVFQKGIDGLCEVARQLPDVRFELYGAEPEWTDALADFRAVRAAAPPNVVFGAPVSGEAKQAMLRGAAAYLQYSRFEGFPLAVTEALAIGVPVACAGRLPFAVELADKGAVALLSSEPAAAAGRLAELLADRTQLEDLSRRGVEYVQERVDVDALGRRHAELYATALRSASDR